MCLGTYIDVEWAFDRTNFANHGVNTTLIISIENTLLKKTISFSKLETQKAIINRGLFSGRCTVIPHTKSCYQYNILSLKRLMKIISIR